MWAKAPSTHRVTQWTIWFGFLGSAVAWFLHLAVVYLIAEAVCIVGVPAFEIGGVGGLTVVMVGATIAAVAVSVVSGLVAHGNLRQLDRDEDISRGVGHYMAHGGMYLSVFFIFLILVQLFPVFFMRPCP